MSVQRIYAQIARCRKDERSSECTVVVCACSVLAGARRKLESSDIDRSLSYGLR